ncbi:MAG: DMT family transporter [Alphaproteobacteria bacterium]|nr:DMT family transporter [Alphaproteobacteria bacterium]
MTAAPRMTSLDWIWLLTLSVLWGGSFLFGKMAVAELPPLTLVLARVGLAALALLVVLRVLGITMPNDPRQWRDFVGMGALNNLIPFGLIFYGQIEIGVGLAAVINGMSPFWSALIARGLGVETLPPAKMIGVLVGFAGLAVMIGPTALAGLDASLIAQLAVVGATIAYGCAAVFGRRFRGQPPMVTATGQLTASTLLVLPLALLVDAPWTLPMPSAMAIGATVALALLSTAWAYILFFRILARAGATNVLLVTLLVPVSAMLLGVAFLGEIITSREIAGMAAIAIGITLIDGRLIARRAKAPT